MWELTSVISVIGVLIVLSYFTVRLNVEHWIMKTLLLFSSMAFLIISVNQSLQLIQQFTTNTDLLHLVVVTQNVLIWFLYILTAYFIISLMFSIFEMFNDAQNNISKTP
jgi:hypothetical protein